MSEPITAARLERLAEEGFDGFMNYLLPHAALKLKQGFGRLIRTSTDRGAVIIADNRVITKSYGAELMRALPPARRRNRLARIAILAQLVCAAWGARPPRMLAA